MVTTAAVSHGLGVDVKWLAEALNGVVVATEGVVAATSAGAAAVLCASQD